MKNKLAYVIMGYLMVSLFFACSEAEDEVFTECEEPTMSPINPNGDSELALLMRQLYVDADSIKAAVKRGELILSDEYLSNLEHVHTAVPTDANVKTPQFEAFNKLLIEQAKALKNSNNQTEDFNLLVNRCVDCHQSFCPGPIKKIKKLIIP